MLKYNHTTDVGLSFSLFSLPLSPSPVLSPPILSSWPNWRQMADPPAQKGSARKVLSKGRPETKVHCGLCHLRRRPFNLHWERGPLLRSLPCCTAMLHHHVPTIALNWQSQCWLNRGTSWPEGHCRTSYMLEREGWGKQYSVGCSMQLCR